jgi:hypothetical protein
MTEDKKSKNPFINMAREAKARDMKLAPEKATQIQKAKVPKPNKGFGGSSVVRRTGRGG